MSPRRRRQLLPCALLGVAAVLFAETHHLRREIDSPFPASLTPRYSERTNELGDRPEAELDLARARLPMPFQLRRGETLAGVLGGLGIDTSEVYAAVEALRQHTNLRRIRAGEPLFAYFAPDGDLASLELGLGDEGRVEVARFEDGWRSSVHRFERRVEVRALQGELDSFLDAAVQGGGGPPSLAYRMADVLQWDLDFNRDLRRGDRFAVLYEEVYLDGELAELGELLAVTYENRGRRFEAYRYGDGYQDAEGRPLRKMFLRSPLPFSRVTSRFSKRRFHPILKTYRPHHGVDYGAPVGTAVRATAAGVVAAAGWNGGGGKTVKLRHPNGYVTAYLHLSRFAAGIRAGRRVGQGEVIGYVGATGLATGPHLDYRVQHDGRWVDPLSLPNVPADPVPAAELPHFLAWRDALRESLSTGTPPRLPPAVPEVRQAAGHGATAAAEAPPVAR